MSLAAQHDFRMGTAFSPDWTRRLPGSFPWVLLWLALVAIVAGLIASTNIAGGLRGSCAEYVGDGEREGTDKSRHRPRDLRGGRTHLRSRRFVHRPSKPAIRRCPSRNGGDRVLRSQRTRSCRSF